MSYTKAEVIEIIGEVGKAYSDKVSEYEKNQQEMSRQIEALETTVARGQFPGGSSKGGGLTSTQAKEHKDAFLAWARSGGDIGALRELEIRAGLSTLSDPDGGALVYEEMEKQIDRLATDSVAMRRIARVIRKKGDYKKPISAGGAGGGWVTEKQERTETATPELKIFNPPFAEMYALPEVTQTLLDTTDFDIESWLVDEINDVFVETEGTASITGNGVGRMKGILAYDTIANASWTWGSIGYIAGGHASLLNNADKLFSLQHALKPVYRRNGTWLMNDTTWETVRTFKDGNGNYLWRPGIDAGAPDILLGRPVEIDDNMPDIGANTYPIAFGDFNRGYTIVDHTSGIRLLRDPYTKKGFVKFYTTKRVAGGVSNHQAIKLLKIAAS